jgi:uncharacterized membrane protein
VTRLLDVAGVVVATLTVGLPAIATRDGFAYDFTNHLWLVWVQDQAISAHGVPTYFLNAPAAGGVFNPFFEFYGGTLYTLSGALSCVLGHRPILAYVVVISLCIGAAYGGMVWLARQCGARTWRAHAPAVTFVTSQR